MSTATDSNATKHDAVISTTAVATTGTATTGTATTGTPAPTAASTSAAVEHALAAAISDAGRVGDLLDVLRTAQLWLPLPAEGAAAIRGTAITLPLVSYLGSDFVPAYASADLLRQFGEPDEPDAPDAAVPHVVVRAADLARLLPPAIGIAINPGAPESVPVYPQGVSYLAADGDAEDADRISVAPLPVRPDGLLAGIAAGFIGIAAVSEASAAWLSVHFGGEGLLISVSLDDPADAAAQDIVVGAVERAAWEAVPQDTAFPIDVIFRGAGRPDQLDASVAAVASPFYRRGQSVPSPRGA
jgi:hypothetical protein